MEAMQAMGVQARRLVATWLLRAAVWMAPGGSSAEGKLLDVVTVLGSGGVGPWRPR